MKLFKLALCYFLFFPFSSSLAEQRAGESMGKVEEAMRVVSLNDEATAFINPALFTSDSIAFSDSSLSFSGAGGRREEFSPGVAVSEQQPVTMVVADHLVSIRSFNNTHIDTIGFDVEIGKSAEMLAPSPVEPRMVMELDSQGVMAAGEVSEYGVAMSLPLSIVNMPISVGVSPKLQKIDTYNYAAQINDYGASVSDLAPAELDAATYRNDEATFNLDIGIAMEPFEGLVVAMSGRDLITKELETAESQGRAFNYRIDPKFAAGIAYDWHRLSIKTDVDLNPIKRFDEAAGTQYWRFRGELQATDWLALHLGYRHELNDKRESIYSLGTGVALGRTFSLDFTGLVGSDDAIGGVLKTSYHF
ncbi:conjugal transfer protein TraF [uncultured Shewanella sp.]|uniref:conjugal transfer protein TraF n=1 Tax=uncultured Shewanella sp. TaxID=173975 RepID=UPI00260BCBAB|nr:conjugal transfer protein TraF [uncultured Shewanella sp.]